MTSKTNTPFQMAMRRFRKNRLAVSCFTVFGALVLASAAVSAFPPYATDRPEVAIRLEGPSRAHWFGTGATGIDVLTNTFQGLAITLTIGLAATAISLIIGIPYGAISGYRGGWVDRVLMRIVDVIYGLPVLAYVMLAVIACRPKGYEWFGIGPDRRWLWEVLVMTLALGSVSWLNIARIVRAQVLVMRELEFVEAARALGAGPVRIVAYHVVPNLLGPVIVYATLTVPGVMLFESFISFLGIGILPPHSSLGLLLEEAVGRIAAHNLNWWLLVFPGGALAAVVLCLNIVGDGLRDAFDVRARSRESGQTGAVSREDPPLLLGTSSNAGSRESGPSGQPLGDEPNAG